MNWTHDTRRQPLARFRYDGEVTLSFPYAKPLVDRLKTEIPGHACTYDPATKQWTVAPAYAAVAVSLLRATFPDAVIEEPGRRAEPQPTRHGDHFAALHLRETAPAELIETAYRTLARLYHPDRGGDVLAMQRINAAYGALTARVAA